MFRWDTLLAMNWTMEQRQQFERDGVIVLPSVLSDLDLEPVINDLEQWIDRRAQRLFEKGEIKDLYPDHGFETRYAMLFEQSKSMSIGFDLMYMLQPAVFEFLRNPVLLDCLEPLLGSEISCNPIHHLRAKPPSRLEGSEAASFHNVPWHQDAGVMMAEAEDSNIITCWVPLVDVTEEMGCMQALPGCTSSGYIPHVAADETMINPTLLPRVEPRKLVCQKGDVILMNRFTPHSSTPNKTNYCRWSLDLRFQPTGQHSGRTAHPDFVVRSRSSQPAFEYEDWKQCWIDALKNPRGFAGHRVHQK